MASSFLKLHAFVKEYGQLAFVNEKRIEEANTNGTAATAELAGLQGQFNESAKDFAAAAAIAKQVVEQQTKLEAARDTVIAARGDLDAMQSRYVLLVTATEGSNNPGLQHAKAELTSIQEDHARLRTEADQVITAIGATEAK